MLANGASARTDEPSTSVGDAAATASQVALAITRSASVGCYSACGPRWQLEALGNSDSSSTAPL